MYRSSYNRFAPYWSPPTLPCSSSPAHSSIIQLLARAAEETDEDEWPTASCFDRRFRFPSGPKPTKDPQIKHRVLSTHPQISSSLSLLLFTPHPNRVKWTRGCAEHGDSRAKTAGQPGADADACYPSASLHTPNWTDQTSLNRGS